MKNKILKASLLFLGSLSLVACGGNPGSSEGGDGGKTEPSNVSKDKTISFWHCIGHDKMRNLNRIITAFNEAHRDTDGYQIVPEKLSGSMTIFTTRSRPNSKLVLSPLSPWVIPIPSPNTWELAVLKNLKS